MSTSHEDYRGQLVRFAQRLPELLERCEPTAHLAGVVRGYDLQEQLLRKRFCVAVMGRMKSGKSTLINALIDRHVAPVGVDETTATVNRFEHGSGADETRFEVHWRSPERDIEWWPLERIRELVGNSELARQVKHLRFSASSPFLFKVTLVDTPGLMSSLKGHEDATRGYLGDEGAERADATILVSPPMLTTDERDAMAAFARQSRYPGQGAYNTVGVLQKWETLYCDDPLEKAWEMARDFAARMEDQVSVVMPVSGLLALGASRVADADLDSLARLAADTPQAALESMLKTEGRFEQDREGLLLSGEERLALLRRVEAALLGEQVGHAAGAFGFLQFGARLARRRGLTDGTRLREALLEASNIKPLLELLDKRFFALSGLIQAGTVLRKMVEPCSSARLTLRRELPVRAAAVDEGERIIAQEERDGAAPGRVLAFVKAAMPLLRAETRRTEATLQEVEDLVDGATSGFELLMSDIRFLLELDDGHAAALPDDMVASARRLFGQFGLDRCTRLGLGPHVGLAGQRAEAMRLHQCFAPLSRFSRIAGHAELRLAGMLDELDTEVP